VESRDSRRGQSRQGDLQEWKYYGVISEAEQGALASRIAAILVVIRSTISKPGSCSYREIDRGLEPLVYKNPVPPSFRLSSSLSLGSTTHIHLVLFRLSVFLLRLGDPTAIDSIIFYQPHKMDSSFFGNKPPSSGLFRTLCLSEFSSRQSSTAARNRPAGGVSQLQGI
jgi:hypothetical protein